MKFDKDVITGILICLAVVLLWGPITRMLGFGGSPAAPGTDRTVAVSRTPAAAADDAEGKTAESAGTEISGFVPEVPLNREVLEPVFLENDRLKVELDLNAGSVRAITLKDYYRNGRKGDPEGRIVIEENPDLSDGLLRAGAMGVAPDAGWVMQGIVSHSGSDREYMLERCFANGSAGLIVRQEWKLLDGYLMDYELTLVNPGDPTLHAGTVTVDAGELAAWNRMTGDHIRNPKHAVDFLSTDGKVENVAAGDKNFSAKLSGEARWISVNNKYLALILGADTPFRIYAGRETPPGFEKKTFLVAAGAVYPDVVLPGRGSRSFRFRYFAGPKIVDELESFDASAAKVMHLAWGPFDWLSKLLLRFLLLINGWVGSYGWSIIILTVVVRLLFWPVSMRANRSMNKMKDIKPKVDELKAKYKNDPQQLNMKTMELYKAEGVNPMGGCLPILLQIPVFIALYQTLESAVQLRQQSFWWIKDMAAPDTVAVVFGLPIHPLVIAMTALMLVQQLITPTAMEGPQKKMMLLMPVVMLFILYGLPAGLTLYWTVSSIFSILQMLLQRKLDAAHNRPAEGKKAKA